MRDRCIDVPHRLRDGGQVVAQRQPQADVVCRRLCGVSRSGSSARTCSASCLLARSTATASVRPRTCSGSCRWPRAFPKHEVVGTGVKAVLLKSAGGQPIPQTQWSRNPPHGRGSACESSRARPLALVSGAAPSVGPDADAGRAQAGIVANATSSRVGASLGTDALPAHDSIPGQGRQRRRMALRPSPTVDWLSNQAQRIVDRRLAELDARAALDIIERRDTQSRNERHDANAAASLAVLRERSRRLRERAHRTANGAVEGVLGAPRSGGA